jgi:hypothetical protein
MWAIADIAIRGCVDRCADAQRWNADITGEGGVARVGFLNDVPLGYIVLASDGGRCEHGGSDQSSRQELDGGQSTSPWMQEAKTFGFFPTQYGGTLIINPTDNIVKIDRLFL